MAFIKDFLFDYRRKQCLQQGKSSNAISQYLSQTSISENSLIKDLEFLVLDFETTGLDVKTDNIISLGYVVIKNLHLLPASSTHILVNPKQQLTEENVGIHQITDNELKSGVTLDLALEQLLYEMTGRVVVVHFDHIEKNFINQACSRFYHINSLPMKMLDTLRIEQNKIRYTHSYIKQESLRLYALRDHYNLPRYKAHNALQDAISTAELFLAQVEHLGGKNTIKLKQLN